jgi:hypothetical protein
VPMESWRKPSAIPAAERKPLRGSHSLAVASKIEDTQRVRPRKGGVAYFGRCRDLGGGGPIDKYTWEQTGARRRSRIGTYPNLRFRTRIAPRSRHAASTIPATHV